MRDLPPPESDRERRTPLFQPSAEEEVRLELEHHQEEVSARLMREGLGKEAAEARAADQLRARELARRIRPGARRREVGMGMMTLMETVWADVRMGVRELRRRPGYALSVLFALGVGIGGSGLLLSLTNSIFLRPIPVPEPDRLVRAYESASERAQEFPVAYRTFRDYRSEIGMGVDLAGFLPLEVGVSLGVQSVEIDASAVSWNYFQTLGLTPETGRFFSEDEEFFDSSEPEVPGFSTQDSTVPAPTASPSVAVIGHELWRTRFGGDPALVGQSIRIADHPVTVVGVAPRDFRGLALDRNEQIWFPIPILSQVTIGLYANPSVLRTRFMSMIQMVARLPEGSTPEGLTARLDDLRLRKFEELGEEFVPEIPAGVPSHTIKSAGQVALGGDQARLRGFVAVVSALSLFVLLVGTLNALQLRLVRLRARQSELGVRRAIGASRARMTRQLLADGVVLVVGGTLIGALLSRLVLQAVTRFTLPGGVALSRLPLRMDWTLLAMLAGISVVAMLGASLIPALVGSRVDPAAQIRRSRTRFGRQFLIASQVALSLVLVASATLFLRSFMLGLDSPLGFDPDGKVAMTFSPAAHRQVAVSELAERILEAADQTPGVEQVALTSHVPVSAWQTSFALVPMGGGEENEIDINVNPSLGPVATMMGMPLLSGRDLDLELDRGQRSAVLNRAAAEVLYPGLEPIGRYFKIFPFERDSNRVVGVVENARSLGVADTDSPWAWLDARVYPHISFASTAQLLAGGTESEQTLLGRLQPAMSRAIPEVLFLDPRPVRAEVTRVLMPQHLGLLLFGIFGAVAALLAAMGVAGVVGFELTSRRREMGIRQALGASWGRTVRPIVGHTMASAVAGVAIGLGLTAFSGRWLQSFLIEIRIMDPMSIAAAIVMLLLSISAATLITLRRIGASDPARVLGDDGSSGGRL